MDTKKIGLFLKQLRTENGMTQEQLGERIGVSNKTISRWETGNYMPPVDSLKILSEFYHISINEILCGERASAEEFAKIAEQNITATLTKLEKDFKSFENKMIIVLVLTAVITIIVISLLPLETKKDAIIFVLVIALSVIANTLNLVAFGTKKEMIDKNKHQ